MNTPLGADYRSPTFWQRLFFILAITVVGTFLYSVGINAFYVPHHFLAGGLTGIAMILNYLTGFPIGIANLILNIPILLLALKFMGKFYTLITIIGTVLCSVFIDLTAPLAAMSSVKQPLVSAIAGGYVVFALNFLIVMASAWIFALELAICTLIAMYINANLSSRLVIGFAQRKAAFIVSDKPLEIADAILRNIHHGATLLYGQGAFSGMDRRIIFAIVDLTQITKLRHYIEEIDPHAFLFIMNTTDVIGRGFTSPLSTVKTMPKSMRYTSSPEGEMVPTRMWQYEMDEEAHPNQGEAEREAEKIARKRMSYRK